MGLWTRHRTSRMVVHSPAHRPASSTDIHSGHRVVEALSTTLSPSCGEDFWPAPAQAPHCCRACCLMRLVSSRTWL